MKQSKAVKVGSPEFKQAYDALYKDNPMLANVFLFLMERQKGDGTIVMPHDGTPEFELMWQEVNLRFPIPTIYSLSGEL